MRIGEPARTAPCAPTRRARIRLVDSSAQTTRNDEPVHVPAIPEMWPPLAPGVAIGVFLADTAPDGETRLVITCAPNLPAVTNQPAGPDATPPGLPLATEMGLASRTAPAAETRVPRVSKLPSLS